MKLFLFSCLSVINIEYSSVNEPSLSGDSFEPKGMWTWAKDHSVEIFFSIMIFYLLYKNNSLSKLMNEMNSQLIAEIEKIKSSLPSKKYINNNIKNLNVHLKKHIQCDKSVKYYFHREIQQFKDNIVLELQRNQDKIRLFLEMPRKRGRAKERSRSKERMSIKPNLSSVFFSAKGSAIISKNLQKK